ncbi:hypothetical protein Mal64_22290 [Pseudobythopirellula maris]|uniref:Uncharacterized protein n=1 Tax=Pseudobythopirellula maris TaxID=2527991 RepID=A0A5C5ZPM9_9BACT|nr:hypothetical protein [Pseudobythopirellula maris]TWT88741.1 hypothetical protein Mal64_22290 [Pseudobythopirellula maris]
MTLTQLLTVDPLAAGFLQAGLLDVLAPFLFVGFILMRHILTAMSEAREAKRLQEADELVELRPERREGNQRDEQQRDANQAQAAAGRPQPTPEQKQLRSEVEDFLKQLGHEPKKKADPPQHGQSQHTQPPRPQPQPVVVEKPQPRKPRIEVFSSDRNDAPRGAAAEAASVRRAADQDDLRRLAGRKDKELRRKQMSRLPESQLAEQAAHLGAKIAMADDHAAERVHAKFDHQIGNLSHDAVDWDSRDDPPPPATIAEQLVAQLRSPAGIRQAVVLNEVLTRPTDRW